MTIDMLFLLIGGWGFYQGYTRGIIKTVFTVISIVFGLMAAFKLSPAATRFIETAFHTKSPFTFIAGFLFAFVLTMIIIRTIAQFLEKGLQAANINVINKFTGGILLASLYTLIYSMMIWFCDKSNIITPEAAGKSMSYPFLKEFPGKMKGVYEWVKPGFQEFWRESVKFMDRVQEKSLEKTETEPTIFDIPEEEAEKEKKPDE
jgi:membrane protein required for colicin V production